jgi:dolichol kinase
MHDVGHPPYKAEIWRKAFHLFNLSIPVIYFFVPKSTALMILIPLTLGFLIVDILRFYHDPTAKYFYRFFGFLLRGKERDNNKKRLNGATYVLISATICIFIFPKLFAVIGLATLSFADSAAALVGRRYGKTKFLNKSLEGSIAFFVFAAAVLFITPKFEYVPLEYVIGLFAAAVATIAEAGASFIDDNFAIPISVASILWIGYTVLLPEINVFLIR